jgi:hypothetical protein
VSETHDAVTAPTEAELAEWVAEWYRALDRHDPVEEVLGYLVDDGLELRFPEGTFTGHDGFRSWYDAVTNRFFDESHEVRRAVARSWADGRATVDVVVAWEAHVWDPPAPHSAWLGFEAVQTWEVRQDPDGLRVVTYAVEELRPMPGSASL